MKNQKWYIATLALALLAVSCKEAAKKENNYDVVSNNEATNRASKVENEGLLLMKKNCYSCHNPNASSHENIIAPPFKAVKMRYQKEFSTKEDFVKAVVSWSQNPIAENALMLGAVKRFNVMPKLPYKTSDLEKIATYLYENEVQAPTWMQAHMKEMKGMEKECKVN